MTHEYMSICAKSHNVKHAIDFSNFIHIAENELYSNHKRNKNLDFDRSVFNNSEQEKNLR